MDRHHIFRLGFTLILYITYYGRSMFVSGLSAYEKIGGRIPEDLVFYQGVQGKPGVDFPVFSRIPRTSFSCKEIESGYYADLEADCQVFHICNDGAKISFLCPNGTIFQQSDLICEWWFKVNCLESPNYYEESAEQLRENTKRRKSFRKVINNIKYNVIGRTQNQVINPTGNQITNSIAPPERKNETFSKFTGDTRVEQLNGNRGQRKFNFNSPSDVSNSLSVGPTQPTRSSSEETQIPEESASFYKNSQNTIQQVGKQVTTNPYPNHRETYSDAPDIKYFYTQPLNGFPQSTSPANPQTRSTNRFPLNDGKPFVVTTPRIQYNINNFQGAGESGGKAPPASSTEPFRYSPTVPPITVTSKSLLDSTSPPNIDSKLASPVYVAKEDVHVDVNPNSGPPFSKIPQSALDNISDDHQIQNEAYSTPGTEINTSTRHYDSASSISTTYLPSFGENYVTSSPIINDNAQTNLQVPVNPLVHANINDNNFNQVTPSTTTLPDHQIVIGHPKIVFDDDLTSSPIIKDNVQTNLQVPVNPLVHANINDNTFNQVAPSTTTLPDHQIVIGHPKIVFDDDLTVNPPLVKDNVQTNLQVPVNPLVHANSNDKTFNQVTVSTSPLPDHQIVIGHPKIIFDDDLTVNPPLVGPNEGGNNAIKTPDYRIKIGHPKIDFRPNTTLVSKFGEPTTSSEQASPVTKFAQSKIDTSTPFYTKISESYSSPSYNTITGFTSNKLGATLKPSAVTTPYPSTEPNIIKIRVNNVSKVEDRSSVSPEPKVILKGYDQGVPVTDSDIFRVSINGQINTERTNDEGTPTKTTRRNGFYLTKQFAYDLESTTIPPTASSSANTYLPKSTTASLLLRKNELSASGTPKGAVNNQETSAGVAQPPDVVIFKDETLRPKPFELPPKTDSDVIVEFDRTTVSPSYTFEPHVYVSSARPFSANTLEAVLPTAPTEFTTEKSSIYDHVHNMINTLKEIADEERVKGANTSRPGLLIPPSAGPQSLHSLAVYFANAQDNITTTEGKENVEDDTEDENGAQAINKLLTSATLNRYHELFKNTDAEDDDDEEEEDEDITTDFSAGKGEDADSFDNDLLGQHSKNPTVTPRVRQLAQVFTKALSSYLDNPDTFKKALQEIRPTEPPAITHTASRVEDDELLNYSDADIVPGLPRLTTTTSISPTWGYILAPNNSNSFEYNSLSSEGENLQSADSQSFVTQFNNLVKDKIQKQKDLSTSPQPDLPNGHHWTSSPGVTTLWRDSLYTHPLTINQNLSANETETPKPAVSSIDYELRSLPKLSLNSTQVHGLLIDFMNSSTPDDSNKLHRILDKLNTTQDEFLAKMRAIEQNPITRRLILLLISECGSNVTKDIETRTTTVHEVLTLANVSDAKITPAIDSDKPAGVPSPFQVFVDPSLREEDDDARALQLLNALYSISSKFGK